MKFYLIDTFVGKNLAGNRTPVFVHDGELDEKKMRSKAAEFESLVTAFVNASAGDSSFKIRYFTSTGEIPACGHATLAAASIFLTERSDQKVAFETIEKVKILSRNEEDIVFMEYPMLGKSDFNISDAMLGSLGLSPESVRDSFYSRELESVFIELKEQSLIKKVTPDFHQLMESSDKVKEVVIMCESESENYDFVLRSFCPWIGLDEDQVTGSIHSVLGGYWQNRLKKNLLHVHQASDRGGELLIKPTNNKVEIGGKVDFVSNEDISSGLNGS